MALNGRGAPSFFAYSRLSGVKHLIESNFGVVNNGALLRLAEHIFLQSKG